MAIMKLLSFALLVLFVFLPTVSAGFPSNETNGNVSCSFETDLCKWENDVENTFDWLKIKAGIEPDIPVKDHLGNRETHFLHTMAKKGGHNSIAARIDSFSDVSCFGFWYNYKDIIDGDSVTYSLEQDNGATYSQEEILNARINSTTSWQRTEKDLNNISGWVTINATFNDSSKAVVFIDEIFYYPVKCSELNKTFDEQIAARKEAETSEAFSASETTPVQRSNTERSLISSILSSIQPQNNPKITSKANLPVKSSSPAPEGKENLSASPYIHISADLPSISTEDTNGKDSDNTDGSMAQPIALEHSNQKDETASINMPYAVIAGACSTILLIIGFILVAYFWNKRIKSRASYKNANSETGDNATNSPYLEEEMEEMEETNFSRQALASNHSKGRYEKLENENY